MRGRMEEEGDAGRCHSKTKSQHHSMIGNKTAAKHIRFSQLSASQGCLWAAGRSETGSERKAGLASRDLRGHR
eukprot:1709702-Pyramimonas_sp.AAC.1